MQSLTARSGEGASSELGEHLGGKRVRGFGDSTERLPQNSVLVVHHSLSEVAAVMNSNVL